MSHEPRPQPMRFRWEQALRADTDLPANARLVALMLATYANLDGEQIAVSIERLAANVGLGDRQTRRGLSEARDRGWVEQVRRGTRTGDGRTTASVHRLTIPDEIPQADTGGLLSARSSGHGRPVETASTGHPGPVGDVSTGHEEGLYRSPVPPLPVTGVRQPTQDHHYQGGAPGRVPRCAAHADIPDDDPGPNCLRCRNARLAAETQASDARRITEANARDERTRRRTEVAACPACNTDGWNHDDPTRNHHDPSAPCAASRRTA